MCGSPEHSLCLWYMPIKLAHFRQALNRKSTHGSSQESKLKERAGLSSNQEKGVDCRGFSGYPKWGKILSLHVICKFKLLSVAFACS